MISFVLKHTVRVIDIADKYDCIIIYTRVAFYISGFGNPNVVICQTLS